MEKGALARLLLLLLLTMAAAAAAAHAQSFEGEACEAKGGARGACRAIGDCPEVRAALLKGEPPVVCSYDGFTPIVCCPPAAERPTQRPTQRPGYRPGGAPAGQPGDRVATRMCNKYADAVYRYEKTFQIPPQTVKIDQCAIKGLPFIVGGEQANPDEFPHMALLGYGNAQEPKWECGGSLISERFVLTAAHCLSTKDGNPTVARLGELNLKTTKEINQHVDYPVAQSIPHPEYKDGVHYHDVGLLRLGRDVAFTASIRPVCLHTQAGIAETDAIASGWGYTDWIGNEISEHLMKVTLPFQKTEVCNKAFKTLTTTFRLRKGITEDSMVCAGTLQGGKDTCRGDSGGPLQVKLKAPYCMYSVVGITSFGPTNCGSTKSPAVYTRVSRYVPWIESVSWPGEK